MVYTKKDINEIVDSDSELIGSSGVPQNGANMETKAGGTTDKNVKTAHQPYRYDMLGRFGFTLLPFFEGKEDDADETDEQTNPIIETLASQLFEFYKEILEKYYRNPQKLKSDFRKISKEDYETGSEEFGFEPAERIFNEIKPHFEEALKELDENLKGTIEESTVIDEKMLDGKEKTDVVSKGKSNDILDKKIKKVADLINKLDKDEVKKIKGLLETD